MKPLITTLFTVLLAVISFEAASECSDKTIELIKSASRASGNLPASAGGGIKDKAIAFVQSALRDNPNVRDHNIALIRACTDSDLASITPKAKASQSGNTASNCEQEVRITYRTGGSYYDASFRHLGGLDYEVFWHQNGQRDRGFLGKTLRQLYEDAENTNTDSPEANREWRKVSRWAHCLLAGQKGNSVSANSGSSGTQAQINVGNASEVIGQRPNRKNAFNPSSPQGAASAPRQSGTSDGECKSGDPSCAIKGCNRSGGKAITHQNNLGCGVVSCRYADSKNDWSSVYNNIPGSGCAGSTK